MGENRPLATKRIIGNRASRLPAAPPPPAPPHVPPLAPTATQVQVDAEHAGQRLDNYLLRELRGVPKTRVYRMIRSGEVRVNKGRAGADTRLAAGDWLRLPPVRTARPADPAAEHAPPREFPVVFEDEHLLVIDKPAGVAVHGGSGVAFGVIEQLRRARPEARFLELVHRLDRDTSGLLMLAKRRSALTALQEQLRERRTHKVYAALVTGAWPDSLKVLDTALKRYLTPQGERRVAAVAQGSEGAQRSISLVRVSARYSGYTLLHVTLKTGRTHQIRVHLSHAGHALVGDDKYGDFALNKRLGAPTMGQLGLARMFLHAEHLAFDHPASGERITLHAPLPPECTAFLAALATHP